MKKIFLLLMIIGFVSGCGKISKSGGSILTLNECQYAIYNNHNGVAMVHAGNCNNKIHIQSRTLK